MNKSIMMGRLVRDPEIRYSKGENQVAIANFRLAVDRKYVGDDDVKADFFRCTAFGRLAEFVEDYLVRGIKIVVTGRIQNDNYTNKDGDKVYGICVMAEDIEFAESKKAQEQGNDGYEDDKGRDSGSRRNTSSGRGSTNRSSGGNPRDGRGNSRPNSRDSGRGGNKNSGRGANGNSGRGGNRSNPDDEYMAMDEEDYGEMAFD